MYHKADMVINTINHLISINYFLVSVKIIREYNEIKKSDRSTINFIWRNLELLAEKGIITQTRVKPAKRYRLPKKPILLEQVINQ